MTITSEPWMLPEPGHSDLRLVKVEESLLHALARGERPRAHSDVRVVRATISPDNHPSLSLVAGYGFAEVGEQWDDEDGLEISYEVAAGGGAQTG